MPVMLDAMVRDGSITLLALAVLSLELFLIVGLALWRGRRPRWSMLANGLSGLSLILALRAALVGEASAYVALFLALGGAAHIGDLLLRQREGASPGP